MLFRGEAVRVCALGALRDEKGFEKRDVQRWETKLGKEVPRARPRVRARKHCENLSEVA